MSSLTAQDIEALVCIACLKIPPEPRLQFLEEYNKLKSDPFAIQWVRDQFTMGQSRTPEEIHSMIKSVKGIPT